MIKRLVSFFNSEGLVRDSSILFVGMAGGHVLNLLFQMVMGRHLPDEEYALLISLLSMLNIFSIPLGVIAAATNRSTSLLIKENRLGDVRRLLFSWGIRLFVLGGILGGICILMPQRIAAFFHLNRAAPVVIMGVSFVGIFCRPIFDGALLGMQCFKRWSLKTLVNWVVRLLVGGTLVVWFSSHAGWGLLGHGLGIYLASLLALMFILRHLRGSASTLLPLPSMQSYIIASFFIMFGYSVVQTVDVIMVKNLYPADQAQDFAKAATLGRLVVFAPQAFVGAMFPKVVSEGKSTREHKQLFVKTLLMTLVTTVSSALVFMVFVRFLLLLIFGIHQPSVELVSWSCMLSWAMVPVSLLCVTVRFALAQKRFRTALIVPIMAAVYAGASWCFRAGIESILLTCAGCSLFALFIMLIDFLRPRRGGVCA